MVVTAGATSQATNTNLSLEPGTICHCGSSVALVKNTTNCIVADANAFEPACTLVREV